MPIKKAEPAKKYDITNTKVKDGKPSGGKAPPPTPKTGFHENYAPVQQKPQTPTTSEVIREAITATKRRERDAGT